MRKFLNWYSKPKVQLCVNIMFIIISIFFAINDFNSSKVLSVIWILVCFLYVCQLRFMYNDLKKEEKDELE